MVQNRAMLDDFAGKMTRLRETYNILNANWPAAWSPDPLVSAMQTGDRIGYYPDTAFAEMSTLQPKLAGLAGVIEAMHATENSPAFAVKNVDSNANYPSNRKLEEYNAVIDMALAHIAEISETQPRAAIEKVKTQGQ